ncbi:MAG: hypothetical protein NXH91_06650 [Phyllobacteriaceae bacterium]|jgi:hypothetical protein|nr:hypothetical protein [Phyllobacteriaceae bacterium]
MAQTKERAAFTLSAGVKAELEKAVPKSKRSRFVERAIADALMERSRRAARQAIRSAPAYSTQGADSVETLERIRAERDRELAGKGERAGT